MKVRHTESTQANEQSSRSHAIIQIHVHSEQRKGRLTLLDCAGSEWNADSQKHCAKRQREGAEINSSLHALKQCVRSHWEKVTTGRGHIPFRDSLLTRILADHFDGQV